MCRRRLIIYRVTAAHHCHLLFLLIMDANDWLNTTSLIVADYINWRLDNNNNNINSDSINSMNQRIMLIVRRVGSDCERLYKTQIPVLNWQILTPSIDQNVADNIQSIHNEIVKEMFIDDIINWSRIIMFVSFSAILCKRIAQAYPNLPLNMVISLIVESTVRFFDTNFRGWFQDQNDWVNIFFVFLVFE